MSTVAAPINPDRTFFTTITAMVLVMVFIGFAPTFFLKEALDAPDLSPRVHVHAVFFTAWPLLLLGQALLIRGKNHALHRTLGMVGLFLVVGIVITGYIVLLGKPRFNAFERAFIFTPMLTLILFPLFVATAIRFRRDAGTHKRLMLLASIMLIAGAARRALHLIGIEVGLYETHFITYALFLIPLAIYDVTRLHRLHAATAWGGAILLLRHALQATVGYTDQWQHFAAQITP